MSTLRALLRPYVASGPPSLEERLAKFIDYRGDDQCWEWKGHRNRQGYGKITVTTPSKRALLFVHRVVYELLVGPIPKGLDLDHLCSNPPCCNPAHLEPVTHRENTLRGRGVASRNAAVTHCPQGHPYDEENTVIVKMGRRRGSGRRCRQCNRAHSRASYKRRKAASAAARTATV